MIAVAEKDWRDKMKRYINIIKLILPVIAVLLSVSTYYGFDDSGKQKSTEYPYYRPVLKP